MYSFKLLTQNTSRELHEQDENGIGEHRQGSTLFVHTTSNISRYVWNTILIESAGLKNRITYIVQHIFYLGIQEIYHKGQHSSVSRLRHVTST